MDRAIEIVEPTLEGRAGHCRSFVEAFCAAGRGTGWTMRVWAGRRARGGSAGGADVVVVPYFYRRARRVQGYFLYRRLLSGPGRLFVATAGRADLALLSLAAGPGGIPPGKVFLYFHWLRPVPGKVASLRRMAARLPGATVLGPTPSVVDALSSCGFPDARVAPYPIGRREPDGRSAPPAFTHLLYAGAARRDKGFGRVVDLVALLAARGEEVPVTIQVSPDHYGKREPAARAIHVPAVAITGQPADRASSVTPLTRSAKSSRRYGWRQIAPRNRPAYSASPSASSTVRKRPYPIARSLSTSACAAGSRLP